mmetsp:Transcript_11335/g.14934  ORF Transcript_11335/g.14934 Transcript_11335/m.14934 type:complete len:262 (-) Transcript_11335:48-833(-)
MSLFPVIAASKSSKSSCSVNVSFSKFQISTSSNVIESPTAKWSAAPAARDGRELFKLEMSCRKPPLSDTGLLNHSSFAFVFSGDGLNPCLMVRSRHESFKSRTFSHKQSIRHCSANPFPVIPQTVAAARSMAGDWPMVIPSIFMVGKRSMLTLNFPSFFCFSNSKTSKPVGVPSAPNFKVMGNRSSSNSFSAILKIQRVTSARPRASKYVTVGATDAGTAGEEREAPVQMMQLSKKPDIRFEFRAKYIFQVSSNVLLQGGC